MKQEIRKSKRTPCPTCHAKTEKQAEKMCRPKSDWDGCYDCIGAYMQTDSRGYFINGNFNPTEEELDQL